MKGFNENILRNDQRFYSVILAFLFVFSSVGAYAEDRIAADTQFNGNLALTTNGEYAIAKVGWEDFIRKYPENSQLPHAEHYLAICLLHTQEYAASEKLFEKVLSEGRFPNPDEVIYFLGVTLLEHAGTLPSQMTGSRLGTINTVADRSYAISPEAVTLCRRALTQFQTLRSQFPDSRFRMEATYYEALAFIQLGNYENALGDLKLVVATRNFSDLNRALYTLAEVSLNLPEPDEKSALITLQTLVAAKPEPELHLRAVRLMGDIYFRLGNHEAAAEQLQSIFEIEEFAPYLNPEKESRKVLNLSFLYYRYGDVLVRLRRYGEAVENFKQVSANFPESPIAPYARYQQALSMKKFNENLPDGGVAFEAGECASLWRAVLADPLAKKDRSLRNSATHQLALYYLRSGDAQKALSTVDRVSRKSRTMTLQRDRADALKACERFDEAIAAYRQLFQASQSPKSLTLGADAMLQVVWIYAHQEDFQNVLQVTGEVILWDGFSRIPEVMQETFLEENARALFCLQNYTAAREGWERLLERFPKSMSHDAWLVAIARCSQKSGESRDGYRFILKNLKNVTGKQEEIELQHLLGLCYRDYAQTKRSQKLVGKYLGKAQTQLIKAKNAARKSDYSQLDLLYYDLSMVYFLKKDYKKCIQNIGFGLKKCPDSPVAEQLILLKGRCEVEMGALDQAAETFESFLEKFPNSPNGPEAGLLASQCFLKLNQTEKAVQLARELAARFPDSQFQERGANVQAIAAMESADYDAAIEAWKVILNSETEEFRPLHPEARYEIGYCLLEKKEFAQAEQTFRELLREFPDWDSHERVYNQLVKALLEQKKLQEAQDALAEMSGKFPESVYLRSLFYQLGTLWFSEGRMEEAESALKPVLNGSEKESETAEQERTDFIFRGAEVKTVWTLFNRRMFRETIDFVESRDLTLEIPTSVSDEDRNGILANRAELRFLVGMASYHLGNPSKALKELKAVRKESALAKAFSENALEMIVQIHEDAEKWESVLSAGREFLEIYPDSEGCVRVNFKCAMALFHLQQMEEALTRCEELLAANDPIFTSKTLFLKGEILFSQKQYESAIQMFYQVIYGVEEPQLQADALFEAAQCFELLEKPEKALSHYHDLLQKFPNSDKVKLTKRKMKKLQ